MIILGSTIDRDGVGLGVGICALAIGVLIAWSLIQLTKNLDPASIAIKIGRYVEDTKHKLDGIDRTINDSDRKIDTLLKIAERSEEMMREARNAGLDMSGELRELKHRVDDAIKSEIARK
jgi:low affinity Fe/Cu permease